MITNESRTDMQAGMSRLNRKQKFVRPCFDTTSRMSQHAGRLSLKHVIFSLFFLLTGSLASGQAFSVSDREAIFYKGGGVQSVQLETATGVVAGTPVFYSAARAEVTGPPLVPAHASPTTDVIVPVTPSVTKMGDAAATRLADDTTTHPTMATGDYASGDTVTGVTGVKPKGGSALTLETTLANLGTGEYHVSASPDFTVSVFNSDIGTAEGNILTYTITYTVAASVTETGTTTSTSPGIAIFRKDIDQDFDYPLAGGLFLKYESMVTDTNGIDSTDAATTDSGCTVVAPALACDDPADNYYTVDTGKPPTLWGNEGLTTTGKHTFTYQLGSGDGDRTAHDTLSYSALILDPAVWSTTSATIEIAENTTDLTRVNAVIAADRNSDGDAAADREIEFAITKGGNVFEVSNVGGNPVLALKGTKARLTNPAVPLASIDYEASGGQIAVDICASGDHVPAGTGADGAQCYSLTVVVTKVNEAPHLNLNRLGQPIPFETVYLPQTGTLPSSILLTDHFTDPDGDSMTMTLSPKIGAPKTGLTTQTQSIAGGYDVTASIVGGTVLSFSKKLPTGEVLTSGIKTYSFSIYANDGALESAAATYTINIKVGANTPPVWIGGVQSATWKIAENATGPFSDSVSATDVDGDDLTYTLVGQSAAAPNLLIRGACLQVNPTTGAVSVYTSAHPALRFCKGFDFEAASTRTFQISVKDNYGGVAPPVTITVMITDVNEPPVNLGTLTNINMYTGTREMRVLGDHFRDPEGTDLSFDAVARGAMVRASLSGDVLTLNAVSEGTTNVLVIASDATGLSITHEIPIKIKKAGSNNAPFFDNNLDAVTFAIDENSPAGTLIGSALTATDPDEDPIMYELLSHKDRFNISQANGQLSAKASANLNHEKEEVINFVVRVSDGDFGGFDYVTVTVFVQDVNERPVNTGEIPDQVVILGDTTDVQVDKYFEDEDLIDQGNLFFSPFVVNPLKAEASATRGVVTVSGLELGETSVVVTAIDSGQEEAVAEFGLQVVENLPPRVVNPVAMQVVMPNIPAVIDIGDVFEDEQAITFSEPVTGNPDILLATLVGADDDHLALVGLTAGLTNVTITATDASGGSTSHTFDVRVNSVPLLDAAIADMVVNHGSSLLIDLAGHFSDPDAGDTLTFTASSDNEFVASPVGPTGTILEIDGSSPGNATITVTATDDWGAYVMDTFMVEVNALPMVATEIEDVNLVRTTDSVEIDLSMHFSDADDHAALTYMATSSMEGVVSLFVSGGTLVIQGVAPGMTMITATATDPHDATVTDMFAVRVNSEPMVAMAIDDVILKDPMTHDHVDLSKVFEDADEMDMLSFTASSSDEEVVEVRIDEHILHLEAVAAGTATVTVIATDDLGAYTMDSFMVRVNAVPMVAMPIEDMNLVTPADSLTVDLSMHFSDSDEEDMLTYMAESSNMAAATVSLEGHMLTVQGVAPGDTEITVTATDDNGASAMDMFMVHVNAVPMVAMEIDDMILQTPASSSDIDLTMHFSDADMETLTFTAESANTAIATVMVDGATLTVQGVMPGNTMITVTATDMLGASAMDSFMVRVNAVPMVANPLADVTVTVGTPLTVDLSNTFTDADAGDTLTLTAMSSNTSLATVAVSGTSLTITGALPGTLDTTVTATDDHGASASDTFTVTVKTVPMVAANLPNVSLEVGGEPNVSNVAPGFSDADGDPLTYTVSLGASGIATSAISGSSLTLEAVQRGTTSATVTATDPDGNSASQTFSIDVNNDKLVEQANKSLAVFGQAMLGSFSDAIGNRVTRVRNGANATSLKQVLSNLADVSSGTSSIGLGGLGMGMSGGQQTIAQHDILDLTPGNSMNSSSSLGGSGFDMFNRFSTPRNFALNFGADGGGFGVWGSADTTNYEGVDYEGDATFIHVGADFETANCWLFGVAVTRGTGSNTFSYGTAERDMDISLTAFSPYLRYQPSDDASIWGAASFGSGDVDITGGADNASGDLESNLFLVGGRRTINEMGNITLAIRGEVAMANLSTDSGDDIAAGLDVSVNRVRGVLEATFGDPESGFQPFIDVGIRNDGGDGDTGAGFEVAGGITVDSDNLAIEARAHTLASHGAEDYSESGISVLARIQPSSASGEGFAFEFQPRYGANYSSSGLIWNLEQQQMRQSRSEGRDEQQGMALASRMSYSVAVSGDRFMISPFVDYDKQQASRTRILIGTEIGSILENAQRLSVEAAVGLIETHDGRSDQLFGMNARLQFK